MTTFRHVALSIAVAAASFGAFAQADAEHTQHHPAEPTKNVTKTAAAKSQAIARETKAAMESKMKTMREMHDRLMAAKAPEERKALMADHMKAMQEGMSMMGTMGGTSGTGTGSKRGEMSMDMMAHHEMMEKRLEMMTTIMQMTVDQLPASATQ